jgi:hypothetical protein
LPAEVEAAQSARDAQQRPERYLDPVSLASPRKHTTDLQPASAARQVRITLREQDTAPAPGAEHITEVVAAEITRLASPPPVAPLSTRRMPTALAAAQLGDSPTLATSAGGAQRAAVAGGRPSR